MHHLRTLLTSTLVILLWSATHAQVVINEISYNPPEGGTDSLEYIELLNAGDTPVNLNGWYFQSGIEDTLPDITLGPGEYFVTAVSAQAMQSVFGITVHQWVDGGLNNNGELLWLVDENGSFIDSVRYDDADPWVAEPDGNGPSLELISATLDNGDGASWKASEWLTGVTINGIDLRGTPGAENIPGGTQGPAATINIIDFAFNPNIVVVKVGDIVRWVNDSPTAHNVNGSQGIFPGNPESFGSGAPAVGPWTYDFQFTIPGTYQYQCDPHAGMGMTGTVYVYDPNGYTEFPLDVLRTVNGNGQAYFDNVRTTVTGIVHGGNFQPSGYSFYAIDETNTGINVFSFDPGALLVTDGDRVEVQGRIDQFNGLLEIIPDAIFVLESGQSRVAPADVDEVTESLEGSYLFVDELIADSITNVGAGGYNLHATTSSGKHVLIRIDADVPGLPDSDDDLFGEWLQVYGIGTQFDSSLPFTEGYQVLALELEIIIDAVDRLDPSRVRMFPNPVVDALRLETDLVMERITIYDPTGRVVRTLEPSHTEARIGMAGLPAGWYVVRVGTAEGEWSARILKIGE